MKSEEVFLTSEQKREDSDVLYECFRLMQVERLRYEKQAKILLATKFFLSKIGILDLAYSVRDDRFICDAHSNASSSQSFSIELQIPDTQEEQIETLIELFAQSEAGLIH